MDTTNVESVREITEIKLAIHKFLDLFREILGTDTCYLYLINEAMDDYEKAEILEKRMKFIRSMYSKNFEKKNEQAFEQTQKSELVLPPFLRRYESFLNRRESVNNANLAIDNKSNTEESKFLDKEILKSVDILKFIDISKEDTAEGWNITFDNRPAKYVLFKELREHEVILGEGLTAYLVRNRRPKQIYNYHKEIEDHLSVAFSNRHSNVTAKPCQMLLGFPLLDKNNNAFGVVKAEKYLECKLIPEERKFLDNSECECKQNYYHYKYNENDPRFKAVQSYIPLLVKLIQSSKRSFQKNSYSYLFHSGCLLENLKKMKLSALDDKNEQSDSTKKTSGRSSTHPTIKEIHTSTMHLFLVLKRNEYVGYEDILERVIHYVKGIGTKLGLDKEITQYFEENLTRFRNHEELLLSGLDRYRDHFMHQFHVFVTGYIIINELGIDNFKQSISKSMDWIVRYNKSKYVEDFEKNNECYKIKECYEIFDVDVLRIWFLTAFYHDFAYILQKLDKELENLFEALLGYRFKVRFDWEMLLTGEDSFSHHICDLLRFFSSKYSTNTCLLLQNYLNSIINVHDHGVLSALLLLHTSKGVPYRNLNECLCAALAISLHNPEVHKGLRERSLTKDESTWISFESFPIAFLLAFCDTAQSFGRLEIKDRHKASEYPTEFLKIDIVPNEKVSYKLLYNEIDKIPDSKKILDWANNTNTVFKSLKFSFVIEHYKTKEISSKTKEENVKTKEELIYESIREKDKELICALHF
jgi:hypothetical protein